jgi:hypothetical protein
MIIIDCNKKLSILNEMFDNSTFRGEHVATLAELKQDLLSAEVVPPVKKGAKITTDRQT